MLHLSSKISLEIETNEIDDGMMLHYYYFFLINPVRNRSALDKIASLNNSRSYPREEMIGLEIRERNLIKRGRRWRRGSGEFGAAEFRRDLLHYFEYTVSFGEKARQVS